MLVSCLVSLHPSPCLHLLVIQCPSSCAWVPNASCFCASAKDQQLGSNLRTRAGRETWVPAQDREGKCEPCGCWDWVGAWRIPMDRGAWWATVHEVAKSQTRLSDLHFCFFNTFGWSSYNHTEPERLGPGSSAQGQPLIVPGGTT